MKKNKKRHVHYCSYINMFSKAICGKRYFGAMNTYFSEKKDNITCPVCIEEMKKKFWYCQNHGFIDDANVTFDEKCDDCGRSV